MRDQARVDLGGTLHGRVDDRLADTTSFVACRGGGEHATRSTRSRSRRTPKRRCSTPITQEQRAALEAAEGDQQALRRVAARWPTLLEAWAALAETRRRPDLVVRVRARRLPPRASTRCAARGGVAAGCVRASREENLGFLRSLNALRAAASAIGEDDEAERCERFLYQSTRTGAGLGWSRRRARVSVGPSGAPASTGDAAERRRRRRRHATVERAEHEQPDRRRDEHADLPPLREREPEGHRRTRDRADRRSARPVRNAWTPTRSRGGGRSRGPSARTNANDGAKATTAASSAPPSPAGGVADDRDRLDDGPGCDLPERDGVEELPGRHPVVDRDGVVLHQRHDHEAAAEGERADLEGDPRDRAEARRPRARRARAHRDRSGATRGRRRRRSVARGTSTCRSAAITTTRYGPTVAAATAPVTKSRPSALGPPSRRRPAPSSTGRRASAAASATAGTAAPAPLAAPSTPRRRVVREEDRREHEDHGEPRADEREAADDGAEDARDAPRAQKIASCVDAGPGSRFVAAIAVLEVLGGEPPARLATHSARSSEMCAGGPPKPIDADAAPLPRDRPDPDARRRRRDSRAEHLVGRARAAPRRTRPASGARGRSGGSSGAGGRRRRRAATSARRPPRGRAGAGTGCPGRRRGRGGRARRRARRRRPRRWRRGTARGAGRRRDGSPAPGPYCYR